MGKNIKECKTCDQEVTIKDCLTETKTCAGETPCNDKYECDCVVWLGTDCIYYAGPDMKETNIRKGDILTDALIKVKSYVEDVKRYLENKLNLQNKGSGVEVYRGENPLGFKEFRTLTGTGATTLKVSTDNNEVEINVPKPIAYKTKTETKGKSLIQEVKISSLLEETIIKGIKNSKSIDISEDKNDLTISVNEAYLNNIIQDQIGPSIETITQEIERLVKEITEKINTFESLIDHKIEESTKELERLIEEMRKEVEALGLKTINDRLNVLEAKTSFVKKGIVFIWNAPLNTIPKGFKECTNLAGRIPIGLLASNAKFNTLGKTGGTDSLKLTEDNLPPIRIEGETEDGGRHGHKYVDSYKLEDSSYTDRVGIDGLHTVRNAHTKDGKFMSSKNGSWVNGALFYRYNQTENEGTHSHKVKFGPLGKGVGVDITNPYRVVHYIEYIG